MTQAQLDYIASLLLAVAESIKPSEHGRDFVVSNLRNFHIWHVRHMPWQRFNMRRKRK